MTPRDSAGRMQRCAAVALALGCAASLVALAAWSPEVTWISQSGDAAWITNPRPVSARLQQPETAPVATFSKRFELPTAPTRAVLAIRAARAYRLRVNGAAAATSPDPDPNWRSGHATDLASLLRAGENEIAVDVWNWRGPPLLRARLEADGLVVASDATWSVAIDGGAIETAVLPDDTRRHPTAEAGPNPAEAIVAHAPQLAALFALAWIGWYAAGRRNSRLAARAPFIALVVVIAAWLLAFTIKFTGIPMNAGFDADGHVAYVAFLFKERRLPLASDGWSMYHPPLYHATVAGLSALFARLGPASSRIAAKSVSFAAALGQAGLALGLARALAPGRPRLATAAVLFAGFAPVNLYMAACIGNETMHALWAGGATLLCVRALSRGAIRLRDAVALGMVLGLALLTKATAMMLAALAGFSLLAKAALLQRQRIGHVAALGAGLALPMCALAGWFYLRSWRLQGTPILANWGDLPGMVWWSQPGFHSLAYYTGFGEALRRPLFAGFHSLSDAFYSSFWGDGWVAGLSGVEQRPRYWRWDWAAIGYWAAVPVTGVLAWGWIRSLGLALSRGGERRSAWSFLLALQLLTLCAAVAMTMRFPYFGEAKASYLLSLLTPLAVTFALGFERVEQWTERRGGPLATAAVRAGLTSTAAVFWLSVALP